MGGDNAPQAVVDGAVIAARAISDISILLIGDEQIIRAELATHGTLPNNIQIRHASQVIDMCEAPGGAIRHKRDSSIVVGMYLVRKGEADAIVSAGNSGAMMAGATLILKAQPGIDRPAIVTLIPTITGGRAIMLDAGATTDCKPQNLLQFAELGSSYAAQVLQIPLPRVGLLSIGEEPSKGDELTKDTHQLLLASSTLNFVGNVEPKEMLRGEVDVVVCDGFVGNLMLKDGEGFGELIMKSLMTELNRNLFRKVVALLLRTAFRQVKRKFDYAEYGGALLLGVNGVVVIGHGRSNATAIENAIRVASDAARYRCRASVRSTSVSSITLPLS